MFPAHATKNVTIPAGTRICQFRIQKEQPNIKFNVVETLGKEDRGGLGSTGV
jgi:dUTP pyrophosphatase